MGTVSPITLTVAQTREVVRRRVGRRIPKRTLDNWIRSGLVSPEHVGAVGKGWRYLLSMGDVARVCLIATLRRDGVSLLRLRVLFARLDADPRLKAELLNPKTRATLVVDRFTAYVVRPGDADVEIETGQTRLPLRGVIEGIEQDAAKLIA